MLDFQIAFDTVPHQWLLCKLKSCIWHDAKHLNGYHYGYNRLQQVTVGGATSMWVWVKSVFPRGLHSVPSCSLSIYDIGNNSYIFNTETVCRWLSPASSNKLSRRNLLQEDLNVITNWYQCWQMRLNINKCLTLQCYRASTWMYCNSRIIPATYYSENCAGSYIRPKPIVS